MQKLPPQSETERRIKNLDRGLLVVAGFIAVVAGTAVISGIVRACRGSVVESVSDVVHCDGDLRCMDLEHTRDVLPDPDEKR